MPQIRLSLPQVHSGWTKVPNYVIDRLMPRLGDTELRLLLILLRDSGWTNRQSTGRQTYERLAKRSGRRAAALSRAARSLAARGVLHKPHAAAHQHRP